MDNALSKSILATRVNSFFYRRCNFALPMTTDHLPAKAIHSARTAPVVPVANVLSAPQIIVVRGDLPVSNLAELVAYAKENPKATTGIVAAATVLLGVLAYKSVRK